MRFHPGLTLALVASPVLAADDLIEVLAHKRVLTAEEHQKLKHSRNNTVVVSADNGSSIQG